MAKKGGYEKLSPELRKGQERENLSTGKFTAQEGQEGDLTVRSAGCLNRIWGHRIQNRTTRIHLNLKG